ncbi:MAG: AbrB/MazE/SpoVT family DNA-binding domain-containing protein [Chthoniobacterales bacterium]
MKATITSKGQITIPGPIRERLGLKAGQVLEFDEEAPFVKAHRVIDREKALSVLGSKSKELAGKTVDEWLTWLRGPVELPPKKRKAAHDRKRR